MPNIFVVGEQSIFPEIKNNLDCYNKKKLKNISAFFCTEYEVFMEIFRKKPFSLVFLVHSSKYPQILKSAVSIKKINKSCNVIFCCSNELFAVEGYKMEISYYLMLPMQYNEFEFVIDKYLKVNEHIEIKSNWQKIMILVNEIHFAEKQGHNIIIHTNNKKYSTRSTFKQFVQKFKDKPDFVNCIKGTIVNLNWVDGIVLNNFIMKNGEKIPIRRKDRKFLKELFFNFKKQKKFLIKMLHVLRFSVKIYLSFI